MMADFRQLGHSDGWLWDSCIVTFFDSFVVAMADFRKGSSLRLATGLSLQWPILDRAMPLGARPPHPVHKSGNIMTHALFITCDVLKLKHLVHGHQALGYCPYECRLGCRTIWSSLLQRNGFYISYSTRLTILRSLIRSGLYISYSITLTTWSSLSQRTNFYVINYRCVSITWTGWE